MKPAFSFSGLSIGKMTSGSSDFVLAQFSPIVLPLTVSAFSWMSLRFISSLTTAGTPPARWNSSPRYLPAGCMLTRSGTLWPTVSQSSIVSFTPMWRAMALMWIGALVEPPIALLTTIVFSNASRVRMSEGFRSSHTMSTMRRPVS